MTATQHPSERWALVTAGDIMRKDIVVLAYSSPMSDIERTFAENKISGAPVVDEAGRIIGIVSLKDLVDRYAQDPDSRPRRTAGFYHLSTAELDEQDFNAFEIPEESEDTAQDVMTADVYSVPIEAGLADIAKVMADHKIHRVLVQDADGRHVGLISTMEIVNALCD